MLTVRLGSSSATPLRQDARTPDWVVSEVQDFVPRRIDASFVSETQLLESYIRTICRR